MHSKSGSAMLITVVVCFLILGFGILAAIDRVCTGRSWSVVKDGVVTSVSITPGQPGGAFSRDIQPSAVIRWSDGTVMHIGELETFEYSEGQAASLMVCRDYVYPIYRIVPLGVNHDK